MAGGAPLARRVHRGRRYRVRGLPALGVGPGDGRPLPYETVRPGPGPRPVPLHPGAPLAVVEQAQRHLRRRGRPEEPGLPGRGRRRVPRPAVHPDLLQPDRSREALRQNGPLGPQHGLHARAFGRLHGGDPGHQRLARPTHRQRPGVEVDGPVDHPRARGRRLPPPGVRGRHRPLLPVPQNAGGALAREPGVVPGRRRIAGHHGLAGPRRPRGPLLRRSAHRAVGPAPEGVAARLPPRLLHPAPAQLLRLRPGLHAARRERDPRPQGRHGPARDLQGHRRGDRRHGPGRGTPAAGRAPPRGGTGGEEAPVHLHGRLRLLLPLPRREPRLRGRPHGERLLAYGRRHRPRLPGVRPRTRRQVPAVRHVRPQFSLSCLNRLQLRNNQQMVDLADPAGALQLAGNLKNPIAGR